jgi:hypothetical protein
MKKQVSITIWFFLFFIIYGKAQVGRPSNYVVKGAIKGVDSGIIRMFSRNGNDLLDSSVITKGNFSMRGEIGLPERDGCLK